MITWNYYQSVLQLVCVDDGHLLAIFVDGRVLIIALIVVVIIIQLFLDGFLYQVFIVHRI